MPPSTNIFLSYSRSDQKFAERFAHALSKNLKSKGINIWLDTNVIQSADSAHISKVIKKAINKASFLVTIVSEESVASPWVNFEIGAALAKGMHIVPVYLSKRSRRHAPQHLAKRHGIIVQGMQPQSAANKLVESLETEGASKKLHSRSIPA